MTRLSPRTGQVLLGKYHIEGIIGRGQQSVVLRVRHIELDELCAVKLLGDEAAGSPEITKRFHREAMVAVKLRSEHAVKVTDVGALPDGMPYMVMELLDGQDLRAVLAEAGPLGVPMASGLIVHACQALSELHAMGMVHRDVKPAKLFLACRDDGTPTLKILDFGLVKITRASDHEIMRAGAAAVGTPPYMAPEQLRSARDLDQRADVWALGVVLYELLSARCPFPAETYAELCMQIAVEQPAPLVGVPPEIVAIVMRCLQKDPAQRFQSVVELATALVPFCGERLFASRERSRMRR